MTFLCGKRQEFPTIVGRCIAGAVEQLGGAFLKAGQILSTRVDLLPSNTILELSRLRDNVRPLHIRHFESVLKQLRNADKDFEVVSINATPLASATIAQIHIGVNRSTGQKVAIKLRRPGIGRLLQIDVGYIQLAARFVSILPWFRRFPIREAVDEVCSAMSQQSDFANEAKMMRRFRVLFAENNLVRIPATIDSNCTNDLIVMEYLEGYAPIPCFRNQNAVAKTAVHIGLHALYKMIFEAGLIHCDLHASNILCTYDGSVALLDFGFVAEMSPKARQDFADFFLSIAFRDGKTAARIVRETALCVGSKLDVLTFERDIQTLLDKYVGRKAADFQVANFVCELFQIQRRHNIYGTPQFTLPILSLLTYEGLIKDICPEIDFQEEAVPFLVKFDATVNSSL